MYEPNVVSTGYDVCAVFSFSDKQDYKESAKEKLSVGVSGKTTADFYVG